MEHESQKIEMPEDVKNAVNILYCTWVVGLIYAVFYIIDDSIKGDRSPQAYLFALIFTIAMYAFCFLLYSSIKKGRNVARIFFIGLTVVALPLGFFKYFPLLLVPKIEGYIALTSIVAQTYAAYLLVSARSHPWFHQNKSIKV